MSLVFNISSSSPRGDNIVAIEQYRKVFKEDYKVPLNMFEDTSLRKNTEDIKNELFNAIMEFESLKIPTENQDKDTLIRIANFEYLCGNVTKAIEYIDKINTIDK